MEGIPTMLTDEEQPLVGTISRAGMPTDGTGLTGIVGIHFDRHTLLHEGFIGNHGVQFSKGPLGIGGVGLALLLARTLALASFGPVSNVSQVFQADERMRISARNLLTHNMIGVLLQPSLSPANHHQPAGSGASAFFLKTLTDTCVMIGLAYRGLTGMEGLLAPGRSGHRQIADTHVYPDDAGMRCRSWFCYFHVQGDEQIELFLGLIIPEFGCPDVRTALNQGHMRGLARIRENDAPLQGQDADMARCLEGIIVPKLIGQGRRNELGSLVQALIPFLGYPCLALCRILLHLGPEGLVGGPHLTGDGAGHLGWYLEASAYFIVGAILQADLVAHLAVLKG